MDISKKVAIRFLKHAGEKVKAKDLKPGDRVVLPDFKKVTILEAEQSDEPPYRMIFKIEGHPRQDVVNFSWKLPLKKLN